MGRAFGRLPHELRAAPLHWLVWDYLGLREAERFDELREEGRLLRAGSLTAMAMHEPKLLAHEQRSLVRRWRAASQPQTQGADELREEGRRMIEALERGHVLDDSSTPVEG